MIICFEGANAVGKSHSISIVSEYLSKQGISHRIYKAPDYQGVKGLEITQFLAGENFSGQHVYSDEKPDSSDIDRIYGDFVHIDEIFRINRDYVFKEIQEDQQKDPVRFILLDRWTLSAIVYSKLRFEGIGRPQPDEYYQSIISNEYTPNLTFVIEETPEKIVQRMKARIQNSGTDPNELPRVWKQSAECYAGIMDTFRSMHKNKNQYEGVCHFVKSGDVLMYMVDTINTLQ